MMRWLRSLTPLGASVLVFAGAVVIVIAAWWIVATLTSGKRAKTEARLAENQAEAAFESGTDAVETVGRSIEYERHVDYITKENERAIRQAPGADAPIDPALHTAGMRALCSRASYSQHPDCLLYAPAE